MINYFKSCFCALMILSSYFGFAQKELKTNLQNFNSGLPSDFVNNSAKKDDYLFLATQRGLCIYDGYRFQNHKSITKNIYNLKIKNNIAYFYDSEKGLCFVNKFSENAIIIAPNNFNDSNANNDHYDNIFIDTKNRIWCSDINYIKYFEPKTFKEKRFEFDKSNIENRKPITILQLKTSEIWFATYKGLFVFDSNKNIINPHFNSKLNQLQISSAFLVDENQLFLTTFDNRFLEYKIKENEIINLGTFPKYDFITQIQLSNQKGKKFLIINSAENIYEFDFDKTNLQIVYNSKKLKINNLTIDDKTHCFWVSTNRGLIQLNNDSNIENINIPSKNPKTVIAIEQDAKEMIFLALDNNEIWSYSKNQTWKKYIIPNAICKNLSVYKNKILVTSSNGLFCIENEQLSEIKLVDFTKDLKKCIVDNNQNLWVIPNKGKIVVFDYKTLKIKSNFIKNAESFWEGNAWNDIICDHFGTIWVAGWMPKSNGILKFDEQNNKFLDVAKIQTSKKEMNFSSDFYNKIAIDKNNQLLFSGYGGFNKVDRSGKVIFGFHSYEQNIPSDHVVGICDDSAENTWFATAEGINVYNPKTSKTILISQIDGLQTDDLIYGFLKLKNGNIILGNENGFSVIDTKKILEQNINRNLKLTEIKIDGEISNQNANNIILENMYSELGLSFSDLSFVNKLKVVYRYKFKGESKWNYLGNKSELSLVKLPFGNYDIIIQSGNNLGRWQSKSLEIHVNVKPKFYQTGWFILLAVIAFLLTNWYLLKQQKIKNNLTQDLKNAEMMTLRSQMNPHFMFNTLNSINSYIIQNKSNEASKYLTMFSKLMRNILENSKHFEITLEKEIQTLKFYVQLEAVRLDNKFDYSITIDENIDIETLKIPPLILQPFVENAIWHGLHNKKEHGNLSIIAILESENILKVSIIDDGIGRIATKSIKNKQTNHKSYGIDITISRLKMLNEENSVEIIDLYNKNEIPNGTQVNLKIHF